MPKTLIATAKRVLEIRIALDSAEAPSALNAIVEVSYGAEPSREVVDLMDSLTTTERTHLDTIVARLVARLQADYLA